MRITITLCAILSLATVLAVGFSTGWLPAVGVTLVATGLAGIAYGVGLWEEERDWSRWSDLALSDAELDSALQGWV